MKARLLHEVEGLRTHAVVFDKGDEVVQGLQAVARDERMDATRITGVGAFEHVVLGYFDRARADYAEIPIDEQVEVLSLVGDIARSEGEPAVHVHVVVGMRDGTARGGHLLSATVWPTLEVLLTEAPAHLRKRHDPETGLALIDLQA